MILEAALIAAHLIAPAKVEAPKPKPVAAHAFYDRPAKIELAAALALNGYDNAQTCQHVSHDGKPYLVVVQPPSPGNSGVWYWRQDRETDLPAQTCGGITALLATQLATQEAITYLLHRTGHHKLERFARLYSIQGNAHGIISSEMHRHGPSLSLTYSGEKLQ